MDLHRIWSFVISARVVHVSISVLSVLPFTRYLCRYEGQDVYVDAFGAWPKMEHCQLNIDRTSWKKVTWMVSITNCKPATVMNIRTQAENCSSAWVRNNEVMSQSEGLVPRARWESGSTSEYVVYIDPVLIDLHRRNWAVWVSSVQSALCVCDTYQEKRFNRGIQKCLGVKARSW